MADYDSFPLWEVSPGRAGNVDPNGLPISEQLKLDLADWANLFSRTLNREDPVNSGFPSVEEEEVFKTKGRALGERLQAELGTTCTVNIKV